MFDPPVSIIKRESSSSRAARIARGCESIIMPAKLTVRTQRFRHINANNIDKLNSLTFKSQIAKSNECSEENVISNEEDLSDESEKVERRRDSIDSNNSESDEESSHSKNVEGNTHNEDNMKVDAFQLTKRSAHSSRVIKPNKRFTDDSKSSCNKNGLVGKKKGSKLENGIDGANKKEGEFIRFCYHFQFQFRFQ